MLLTSGGGAVGAAAEGGTGTGGSGRCLATGPTTAAMLTAGRLGWTFKDARTLVTDDGMTLSLGTDPPAAFRHAIEQAVRRWRVANVIDHHYSTRMLLKPLCPAHPPETVPHMRTQWQRASAAAQLHTHAEDFSSLGHGRCYKHGNEWKSKYASYLLSATANKQWPQARVASTRHPDWNTEVSCQLCKSAPGTLDHRHECAKVLELIGAESR